MKCHFFNFVGQHPVKSWPRKTSQHLNEVTDRLKEVDQIELKLSSYEEMLQSVKEQMDQISGKQPPNSS